MGTSSTSSAAASDAAPPTSTPAPQAAGLSRGMDASAPDVVASVASHVTNASARSSDGARNKAGTLQPPRPRGTAGTALPAPASAVEPAEAVSAAAVATTSAAPAVGMPTASSLARPEVSSLQSEQPSASSVLVQSASSAPAQVAPPSAENSSAATLQSGVAAPSSVDSTPTDVATERPAPTPAVPQQSPAPVANASERPLAKPAEKTAAKPAPIVVLPVPSGSATLKRALDSFTEPPRKRPRLVAGEAAIWEAEYKYLWDWLGEKLPDARLHSKLGAPVVKCTEERLTELSTWWKQVLKEGDQVP